MKKEVEKKLNKLVKELEPEKNEKIKFVFVFGSSLTPKYNKLSDIDIAIYYDGNKKERFDFLIEVGGKLPEYEIHIFQDLPSYVKKEVLKGKLIYNKNLTFVYDVAYQTIQEWDFFKKGYYDYIEREGIKIES